MREIKFRAYDKTRKEYLSAGAIFISIEPGSNPKGSKQYLDIIKDPNLYASRFVIEQYTVLKDRNGKEIYEGDIIVVKGKYERVVLWDEMGWALMPCEHYHDKTFWVMNIQHPGMDWWKLFANNIEVVGNIHDNPDLIK